MPSPTLRPALRAFGCLLVASFFAACQSAPLAHRSAYAVFTDFAKERITMKGGTNVRKFNDVKQHGGDFISYDSNTGYVLLAPGTYHITGYSITTFGYLLSKEKQAAVHSAPGYAFLWDVEANKIALTGSMQDPMYALTSQLDNVLEVTTPTHFFLGHQNGDADLVAGVVMDDYDASVTTSTNHIFGQLIIERW